jgi:hypothetical protein
VRRRSCGEKGTPPLGHDVHDLAVRVSNAVPGKGIGEHPFAIRRLPTPTHQLPKVAPHRQHMIRPVLCIGGTQGAAPQVDVLPAQAEGLISPQPGKDEHQQIVAQGFPVRILRLILEAVDGLPPVAKLLGFDITGSPLNAVPQPLRREAAHRIVGNDGVALRVPIIGGKHEECAQVAPRPVGFGGRALAESSVPLFNHVSANGDDRLGPPFSKQLGNDPVVVACGDRLEFGVRAQVSFFDRLAVLRRTSTSVTPRLVRYSRWTASRIRVSNAVLRRRALTLIPSPRSARCRLALTRARSTVSVGKRPIVIRSGAPRLLRRKTQNDLIPGSVTRSCSPGTSKS